MTRYILVPGACHGAWWYDDVVDALGTAGHHAHAVTLTGLHPDGPSAPAANLDTHIDRSSTCSPKPRTRSSWSPTATPGA